MTQPKDPSVSADQAVREAIKRVKSYMEWRWGHDINCPKDAVLTLIQAAEECQELRNLDTCKANIELRQRVKVLEGALKKLLREGHTHWNCQEAEEALQQGVL